LCLNWCARKEKLARKYKIKDLKFDSYCDPSIFSDWLDNIDC